MEQDLDTVKWGDHSFGLNTTVRHASHAAGKTGTHDTPRNPAGETRADDEVQRLLVVLRGGGIWTHSRSREVIKVFCARRQSHAGNEGEGGVRGASPPVGDENENRD